MKFIKFVLQSTFILLVVAGSVALPPFGSVSAASLNIGTYIGGGQDDYIRDVAIDGSGNIYIAGGVGSGVKTTSGAYDTSFNGDLDVLVQKYSSTGNLIWSTYIGGPGYDRAYAIEVDPSGNVTVAGRAGVNYPTTAGTVQPNFAGDYNSNPAYGTQDGFITKLSNDGSRLIWSTYYGGIGSDIIRDVAVDSSGNVYPAVTGLDDPFAHIKNAFEPSLLGGNDGVVSKISSDGRNVIYASYVGGSGDDKGTPSIRVDSSGNAYYVLEIQSTDAFVSSNAFQKTKSAGASADYYITKVSPSGSRLWATYYGGSGNEFMETHDVAVDSSGNVFISGTTNSTDLPMKSNSYKSTHSGTGSTSGTGKGSNYCCDGFIAKISSDGSQLLGATYIGGTNGEGYQGLDLDSSGNVYMSGGSYSDNYPVTSDALQKSRAGNLDGVVSKFSSDLSRLLFSTYLGGSGADEFRGIDVDGSNVAVIGHTTSSNFPLASAYQSTRVAAVDGVLVKISLSGTTPPPPVFAPTVTLTANPTSITSGQSTTLTWSSSNATSCTNNFGGSGTSGSRSVSPTSNITYSITCTGSGGSASDTAPVSVSSVTTPAPVITLSPSSASITSGQSTTLTWSATNATSCSATWTTSTATSGSRSVSPTTSTDYSITCTGSGGSATKTLSISVIQPAPTVSFTATPTSISSGGSSTLTWSATNATTCTAPWTTSTGPSGTRSVSPSSSRNYSITCTGSGGSTSKSVTVTVAATPPPPTPPTLSLSASPTSITLGAQSTLSWSTTNATSCSTSSWTSSTQTSGSQTVSPTQTTTYTRTCTGAGGTVSRNVTVAVTLPVTPTEPPVENENPPRTSGGGGGGGSNTSTNTITGSNTTVETTSSSRVQIQTSGSPLNVRSGPSPTDPIISKVVTGTRGTIIGAPITSGGYTWIQVQYDNGITGWSAQNYLISVSTAATVPTIGTLTEAERSALIREIQQKIVELTQLLIQKILAGEN